jgi:non-heme chloroperoxidase
MSISPHRVAVGSGVSLFVQRFGRGRPVVFVHAGGMTHAAWDHQVAPVSRQFETVAYDCRGVGASDRPPAGYEIETHAADLENLIGALQLQRPVIVGHGVGAHIALCHAASSPETPSALVLVSAAPWSVGDAHGVGGISDALWSRMRSGLAANRAQADLDLIDSQYFYRSPSEAMRLWCLHMALQWPLAVLQQLIAGMQSLDHRDRLARLRMPVLLAHGRHDRKNRYEGGVFLANHLPDARLETFEESAVCPQLEEVDRFNEVLLQFLTNTFS